MSPEDIARRRELVWALHSQGQKPHQILRYLRDTKTLSALIIGYANPYRIIISDLKKPPLDGMRRKVPEKEYERAVGEAIARLDEQYKRTWELIEKHTEGVADGDGAVYEVVDATTVALLKHLEVITSKSSALMGVTPDVAVEPGGGPAIGTQFNILGTDPRAWLGHVQSVSEAIAEQPMVLAYDRAKARITPPSD